MKVRLQTVPALLRTRLLKVRVCLSGGKTTPFIKPTQARITTPAQDNPVQDKFLQVAPTQAVPAQTKRTRRLPKALSIALRSLLLLISIAAFVVAAILFVPDVYYRVFPADTEPVVGYQAHVDQQTADDSTSSGELVPTPMPLPPQDMSLPEGEWLVIPRIGVRSQLRPTTDPEEALAEGLWMVPDYGQPGDVDIPMIVAGHRYGWQWWWKTDYWKYNSFYNLPELEVGDRVEVIADHRKWVYEIYATQEGEQITDYQANLILYTCKFLNSPIRYFVYARLVPPEL